MNGIRRRLQNGLRGIWLVLLAYSLSLALASQAHAARNFVSVTVENSSGTSVTLNGTNYIEVSAGETLTVRIVGTTTSNSDWFSTGVRFGTSGNYTCSADPTPDLTNSTSNYTVTMTVTAPSTLGNYSFVGRMSQYANCNSGGTNSSTYSNAIRVLAAPTVNSIVRASANPVPTNSAASWTVTFSRSVTGVDASDFQLVQSMGVSGATITSVTGSGTTWTVTANTGNGNYGGDLGLNLVDDDSIVSGPSPLGGSGAGNGSRTGETYMVSPPCSPPANAPSGITLSCVCDNFSRTALNPSPINNASWLTSVSDSTGVSPSIVNQGYLRLTSNTQNNAKAATVPGIFPAAGNYISVEFRLFAYNGSSADGVGVTLSDYTIPPAPGAYGGSLGYAQKTGINGFAGGWIGVGLDEFGNYQNPSEGREGGPGAYAQSVAVRGSGSATSGYRWLAGNSGLSPTIDNASSTSPAPGHRYQIIVDATQEPTRTAVAVNRAASTAGTYSSLIDINNIYAAATAQGTTQAPVPANWKISFTGSTGDSTNIHEIGAVRICAQAAAQPGGGVASNFNAIDEAYGAAPTSSYFLNGHIYMKVVGQPFKLNVAALNSSQQINTSYAPEDDYEDGRTVTIKLVNQGNLGESDYCQIDSSQANYCSASCRAKSAVTGGSQNMTFYASNRGQKQTSNFTINTAYKKLVAIISDSSVAACSTDAFSVRPLSFKAVTRTASNDGASGLPVFKAGSGTFSMTATTNGISGSPSGYTGMPKVNNAALQPLSPATVAGMVAGLFPAATTGTPSSTSTGNAFTYSEVGRFTLPGYNPASDTTSPRGVYEGVHATECGVDTLCATAAKDTLKVASWTGVDSVSSQNDCIDESYANTKNTTGTYFTNTNYGKYGCLFGTEGATNFGRFIPDHFALAAGSALVSACGGVSGFTYMNQPFSQLKFDVEAQNATNGVTKNYTGTLATATPTVVAENNDDGTDLTSRLTGVPVRTWLAGIYSVDTAAATFIRQQTCTVTPPIVCSETTPDGPYDNLLLGIRMNDSADGITAISGANMRTDTAGPAACTTNSNASTDCNSRRINDTSGGVAQPTIVRFGRLRVSNAHGSEKLNLPIPVHAQYWTGKTFVTNTLDDCTAIANANVALSNYQGSNAATGAIGITETNLPWSNVQVGASGTSTFEAGVGRLMLKKPLSPLPTRRGSVDVCIDLGADTAPGTTCSATTSAEMPWLKGIWGGGVLFDDDPVGRATFGIYKSDFIYIREMY